MSIRLDILTLISAGVTDRNDILERLDIHLRSFHNSIRFWRIRGGWNAFAQSHPLSVVLVIE
jgi:hypothetical protein